MEFAPLYKNVTLIIQGKCTNCTKGVQDCTLCRISIDSIPFFFLSSKDCTLSCHTFLYYTLILCILFNLHMKIRILTLLMMFGRKNLFLSLPLSSKLNHWKHSSHIYVDTLSMQYQFIYFLNQLNGNMINSPICTHSLLGIWNLCKRTRNLH